MKYIILVCDGAADWPIESLENKTIFEVSETPSMDWIARNGKMGMFKTIPDGTPPGSDVANMSIMGYRPETDLTGRGPLEALSANVELSKTDIAFRCNIINIKNDLIHDYSSGHITTEESKLLIEHLQSKLKDDGVDFFSGVQYRHILRLDGKRFSENLIMIPPHDQLDKPYVEFLIKPKDHNDKKAVKTADYLNKLIEKSNKVLVEHEINQNRLRHGKLMATHIWPWSGGKKPNIESFYDKYGLNGSVISAVDLLFGLGLAMKLTPVYVKGATGLPNTNYKGKVTAAMSELQNKDFVYLHVEAADEMGHAGDIDKKISAVEDFDRYIVKPFLEAEEEFKNELAIAVLPDHPTPIELRTHSGDPVPFAIYNPIMPPRGLKSRKYSEASGKKGEYGLLKNGEEFMGIFLEK